jgi:uncharacterized protein (TIGR02466 family)|tara:strand:- start:413 stop:994 length:582 start_codon:yes stop_codon:yes gene_type:complete
MIKEQICPTFVYGKDIELDNEKLASDIIEWSKKDKGIDKSNVNGWHSNSNMHLKPEYEELKNALYDMQLKIYEEEYLSRKPILTNMWANINPPNAYNKSHNHANALFSGVYFVKANENSGKLICSDPRPGAQQTSPVRKDVEIPKELWNEWHLDPVPGRIIMFPSWLWHSVEINKSKELRISVSFNFIQDGFQ